MLMNNREKGRDIPIIFEKIANWIIKNGSIFLIFSFYTRALPSLSIGLTKQGIFRLSGNLEKIESYKEKVNQGNYYHASSTGFYSYFNLDQAKKLSSRKTRTPMWLPV